MDRVSNNTYILSSIMRKRFKKQLKISRMVCSGCGKPIKVGDEVVSTRARAQKKRFFHRACYEAKFLDVED